jgi:E3 ubiquitin-protein ligase BAH
MFEVSICVFIRSTLQIHGSVSGRDFKSKMQTAHIELLQSPWLIELGAFHLNCDDLDADELGGGGFFKNGFFKNFSCDLSGAQPLLTMTISETLKYEYSLTCPICLVRYSLTSVFCLKRCYRTKIVSFVGPNIEIARSNRYAEETSDTVSS